jgi:photosystem II stability/assembly factor-like uncharacterized protein
MSAKTLITRTIAALIAGLLTQLHAEWKSLGPFGGSLQAVAIDAQDPDTVLAANSNGILFQSRNGGDTWAALRFPARLRATLHSLLADPQAPHTYFAATSSDSQPDAGVFRTRDAGLTWEQLSGMRGQQVWSLAAAPAAASVVAAGTEGGLFVTSDGGETWRCITPIADERLRPVVSVAFHPSDPRVIYIGTPHLGWKTIDAGVHWTSLHNGMREDSDVFSILVDGRRPERVFAAACSGLYRSVNGGIAWTGLPVPSGDMSRTYLVAQHPLEANTFFAGTVSGLLRSLDGGGTWQRLNSSRVRAIAFDRHRPRRILLATDDAGILRSTDGGSHFVPANQGLCTRHLSSLEESQGAIVTSIVGEQTKWGMLQLPSRSTDWIAAHDVGELRQMHGPPALRPRPPIYAVTGATLVRSIDGGRSWLRLDAPTDLTAVLAPMAQRTNLIAAAAGVLYTASENGRNWQKLSAPPLRAPVRRLVPLSGPAFAAIAGSQLLLTRDGLDWKITVPVPGKEVLGLTACGAYCLLAVSTAGLVRSDDFGDTWRTTGGEIGASSMQAIARDPARAGVYFAAAFGVVYESIDDGQSWHRVLPEGPGIDFITQLLPASDRLFVLTATRGVFVLDRSVGGRNTASMKF